MNKKNFYTLICLCLCGCTLNKENTNEQELTTSYSITESISSNINDNPTESINETETNTQENIKDDQIINFINKEGITLETRINTPIGYERTHADNDSFLTYLRSLTLKEDGSPVLLYSGEKKSNQNAQVAVFDFDIGNRDLQQCADSIIRVYAEYFWNVAQYDKIAFHLTNGFLMEYTKWRDGNRLNVNGNNVSWVNNTSYDDSYDNFRKYLDMVFIYAGTLSLSKESTEIPIDNIKAGDMFLQGGSPGHCVLIVDTAIDETGNLCFLLAQGYMPAQDFHILKNPLHEEDPWYYLSEFEYPLSTPQWNFDEGSLKRLLN